MLLLTKVSRICRSRPSPKPLTERIYQHLLKRGAFGATTDEIEKSLGLFHQSASPAVIQLRRAGYIEYNGQERPTRLGRPAKVHVVIANYIREAA